MLISWVLDFCKNKGFSAIHAVDYESVIVADRPRIPALLRGDADSLARLEFGEYLRRFDAFDDERLSGVRHYAEDALVVFRTSAGYGYA